MRSPKEHIVVLIELTNSCQHSCSNCTRLCGNHKKNFFMDFETFKRAVNSLKDFDGQVGIIGGEPLLHPEFNHYTKYLQENTNFPKMDFMGKGFSPYPKDYLHCAHVKQWVEMSRNKGRGLCLFTSIPQSYYKNFEIINDTFAYQRLNDHSKSSYHQPILLNRKDLGIDDETFYKLRNECWIQNTWSSTITPKGAFFCEVAAHLDLLFDGPGGWPIEPGWWKRNPNEFGEQLKYCELCGIALQTFSREANEGIYDVSKSMYEKLVKIDSPLVKKNRINIINTVNEKFTDTLNVKELLKREFISDYSERISYSEKYLKPNLVAGVIFIENIEDERHTSEYIDEIYKDFDKIYICFDERNTQITYKYNKYNKCEMLPVWTGSSSIGSLLNAVINKTENNEWLLILDNKTKVESFPKKIINRYLNPGILYKYKNLYLFSKHASAIEINGLDKISNCKDINEFISFWQKEKTCTINNTYEKQDDINIKDLYKYVYETYGSDHELQRKISNKLNSYKKINNKILITQSGMVFHTMSIAEILKELGYEVFILTSDKFKEFFSVIVNDENIILFNESHFDFKKQNKLLENIKEKYKFNSAIVPLTIRVGEVKKVDDNLEIIKTANYLGDGNFFIINIKRDIIGLDEELSNYIKKFSNQNKEG